ncbi:hypothetical protein LDENG_00011490 [Lucifuga dentata]|nr:hypothetical protein LDENG_00011490 [Lucifuga dentata]
MVYISELLTPYSTTRPLRYTHHGMLAVSCSRKKKARDRAFSVAAPWLWNSQRPLDRLSLFLLLRGTLRPTFILWL